MGIYWQTLFYKNSLITNDFIVLENFEKILDEDDLERGHILKSELLKYFSVKLKDIDITENACVREFETTTYGMYDNNETMCLPIKID